MDKELEFLLLELVKNGTRLSNAVYNLSWGERDEDSLKTLVSEWDRLHYEVLSKIKGTSSEASS